MLKVFRRVVVLTLSVKLSATIKLVLVRSCENVVVALTFGSEVWWSLITVSRGPLRTLGLLVMNSSGGVLSTLVSSVGQLGRLYTSKRRFGCLS